MTTTNLTLATAAVADEQIAKCARIYDLNLNTCFYLVANEAGEVDDEGHVIEYKVTYSKEFGYRCTCAAGQEGFCHCYRNGVCKHVVWSLAAAAEFHTDEIREQGDIDTLMGSGVSREIATSLAYGKTPTECEQFTVIDTAWDAETREAAARESKAVRRDGATAYERKPFALLG